MTDQQEEFCATGAALYLVISGDFRSLDPRDDRRRAAPIAPECSHQPSWLTYAQGHGGDISVDNNQGEYLFIYTSGEA